MRQALVSLFAAAAVAAPAMAQEATPAVPPAPAETAVTPAQPALPEANPATQTVPAVQTPPATAQTPAPPAADVAPMAVPVPETGVAGVAVAIPAPAPAVEAPPPPPPPPPPPTEPTTVRTLSLLETLCKPMVAGGDPVAITKSLGFRKKRETYTLALTKPTAFSISPSPTNKNVCLIEIDHPVGADKDMTVGLHNWALAQGYKLERNDEFTTDMKRHTRSWERTLPDGKLEALVMVTSRKPDGSPAGRNADHTTVMYSVR